MSPGKFGESSARLCGVASQLLGWRPDEFWCATPAELALALAVPEAPFDAPDASLIAALRRQFPDDEKA